MIVLSLPYDKPKKLKKYLFATSTRCSVSVLAADTVIYT